MQSVAEWSFKELAALITELESGNYTGKISCQSRDRFGDFYLEEGQLIHATSYDCMGEDAFYEMLGWDNGTLQLEPNKRAPEHSLDKSQLDLLHDTLHLFQSRGKFNKTLSASSPHWKNPTTSVSFSAPKTTPQVSVPLEERLATIFPAVQESSQTGQTDTNIEPTHVKLVGNQTQVMSENLFRHCLPPGRTAKPALQLNDFNLGEFLTSRFALTPNFYLLINSIDTKGIHEGLVIVEGGRVQAVRYAKDNIILKAQSAFFQLESVTVKAASEVTLFEADTKILECYRALIGSNYLFNGARAHNLDLRALVKEQVLQKQTTALRFYKHQYMEVYLIWQGEMLGTFHLKDRWLEAGGDLTMLMQQPGVRLDVVNAAPPEQIVLKVPPAKLTKTQATLLVATTRAALEFLSTLSGSQKVLVSTRKVLAEVVQFYPCLKSLNVNLEDKLGLEISWPNKEAVLKENAQSAFNFLLETLLNEHTDLLGRKTVFQLATKALQNEQNELKKEQLSLKFLD